MAGLDSSIARQIRLHPAPSEGGGAELPLRSEVDAANRALWRQKTDAALLSVDEFLTLKAAEKLHVVGVTGFSGQWSEENLNQDPALRDRATVAAHTLEECFRALQARYGTRLVVPSGATNEGVPKLAYDSCEALGVTAMGVTSAKAIDYPLGKMEYLIVEGAEWGEESASFLRVCDELIMIGGGGQAKREAIAAAQEGKKVTVFQGFGGTADQLTAADLPGATFINPLA